MTRPISTHDIDLAAAYMTVRGDQPTMHRDGGKALASFDLIADDITMNLLSRYATGELSLNIRRFASCRNFLYKKLKEVR